AGRSGRQGRRQGRQSQGRRSLSQVPLHTRGAGDHRQELLSPAQSAGRGQVQIALRQCEPADHQCLRRLGQGAARPFQRRCAVRPDFRSREALALPPGGPRQHPTRTAWLPITKGPTMRLLLAPSASLFALLTTPAFAQSNDRGGVIDTVVDAKPTPAAAPAPTGDAVTDRLNALEARVKQLEARNAELEQQTVLNQNRLESVEQRAAKNVQFGWGPTLSDPKGNFTFKPRGVIDADAVA